MSHFHTTTYEDDNGAEWDIKISFNVFPGQVQTLEDPGLDAELEIDEIWRHEPTICQDTLAWVPFVGESDEMKDSWEQECWVSLEESI
ncbi:hypothetical protein N9878_01750 [bacterium]|nr:hypothetical protein [bacterium]